MNRRRHSQRGLRFPEIVILALAGLVLMTAGVVHAWIKNSHVEVMREVDKTEQRIKDHEDSINSLQVKIDKKLNIYQLRDDLERADTRLVMIPVSAIEKIPAHTREDQVTESDKDSSSVAQRRP